MTKKKKSINPAFRDYGEGEIHLSILDFEKNGSALIETILSHVRKSECKDCQWYIHVIDEIDLDRIKLKNRNCLLKIFIEKELIGNVLSQLKGDFNIEPLMLRTFNCVVLVYCLSLITLHQD